MLLAPSELTSTFYRFFLQKNGFDSHSIKLLNIVVTNKAALVYSDDEILKIIEKFWNAMIADLSAVNDPDIYQPFVKFVFNIKTSEELIQMLTDLNSVRIHLTTLFLV